MLMWFEFSCYSCCAVSSYKLQFTFCCSAESCFHLHKILDSILKLFYFVIFTVIFLYLTISFYLYNVKPLKLKT